MSHDIENFFGVYLLCCRNEKYKGYTYIGFTVDPNRRIKQHNTGSHAGGAHRTSGRGPWDMVLIIHGFPNQISALRKWGNLVVRWSGSPRASNRHKFFEWAWQNPKKSKRLRHLVAKRNKETAYQYRFRLVCEMLRTSPWNRLPLTIRWLKQEFQLQFDPTLLPPKHMPVQFGPVKPKKIGRTQQSQSGTRPVEVEDKLASTKSTQLCALCAAKIQEDDCLRCINSRCHTTTHTLCLAQRFLSLEGTRASQLVPIDGPCPKCKQVFLWGDLIRFKHGCYQNTEAGTQDEDCASSHWADDLDI